MGLFGASKKSVTASQAAAGLARRSHSDLGQPAAGAVVSPQSPPLDGATARQLLLVGEDQAWFQQTQRELRTLEPSWLCHQAADRAQALSKLPSVSFDALVLDGNLDGGSEFLKAAEETSPETLRLVRCDLADRAAVSRWGRPGVSMVGPDEGTATLAESLNRGWWLQTSMAVPPLKKLLSLIRKLPAIPKLHTQVTEELRKPEGSMEVVGRLIAQDPVMAAKILQVVNSALFGLAYPISDPAQAIMFLGTERTRALILLAGVFSQFDGLRCPEFSPERIWVHSLQVGSYARLIALAETRDSRKAEMAFTAGLLHDLGKLVLAANLPEMFNGVRHLQIAKKLSQTQAEMEVVGATHAQLGACLLGTWGLPLPILLAIAWHHCPDQSDDQGFSLMTAVHAANIFAQESGQGSTPNAVPDRINLAYMLRIGLGDRRNVWRELCNVPVQPDEDTQEERLRRRRDAKVN